MIYFEYKETIFQRKTSKGKEEHIKKYVLMIEYFASRLFVR